MSILKVNYLGKTTGYASPVGEGYIGYWSNFDETGTFEINDSFNSSSITDGPEAGMATVNYSNPFGNSYYSLLMMGDDMDWGSRCFFYSSFRNGGIKEPFRAYVFSVRGNSTTSGRSDQADKSVIAIGDLT